MKQNYIIPIFISHKGCPNQCTFCNQRKISGSLGEINLEEIEKEIDGWVDIYNLERNDEGVVPYRCRCTLYTT